MMRIRFIILTLLIGLSVQGCSGWNSSPDYPESSDPVYRRPQIVHVRGFEIKNGVKSVRIGNSLGEYYLSSSLADTTCVTPVIGVDYFIFTKDSRWKWEGAKDYVDLKFFNDWSYIYPNSINVAVVPAVKDGKNHWKMGNGGWGIYVLDSWKSNK